MFLNFPDSGEKRAKKETNRAPPNHVAPDSLFAKIWRQNVALILSSHSGSPQNLKQVQQNDQDASRTLKKNWASKSESASESQDLTICRSAEHSLQLATSIQLAGCEVQLLHHFRLLKTWSLWQKTIGKKWKNTCGIYCFILFLTIWEPYGSTLSLFSLGV